MEGWFPRPSGKHAGYSVVKAAMSRAERNDRCLSARTDVPREETLIDNEPAGEDAPARVSGDAKSRCRTPSRAGQGRGLSRPPPPWKVAMTTSLREQDRSPVPFSVHGAWSSSDFEPLPGPSPRDRRPPCRGAGRTKAQRGGCEDPDDCYATGDAICDTNLEAEATDWCDVPKASCGSDDPIHNYMDYTDDM